MRKQYHFRPSPDGLKAWGVHRLIELSKDLPRQRVPLTDIRELDQPFWFAEEGNTPTCRAIAEHMKLVEETDLAHPIILSADGGVMDGMHRVVKALVAGLDVIEAVQFTEDPEHDYVGVDPDDLPYGEEEI